MISSTIGQGNSTVPGRAARSPKARAVWHGSDDDAPQPHAADNGDKSEAAEPKTSKSPARTPRIVQRIDDRDPERANAQALEDIAQGAGGIAIVFEGAPNAFGYGLPARPEALTAALRDIPIARTHLRLDLHPQSRASVDWLVRILSERKIDPSRLDISFGIDPAATFAGTGRLRMSIEALLASLPQSLGHFFALGVPGILLEADGRVFHNSGATAAQELGIMLASATTHLRMFEEARQPVLYAAAHIGFAVSVDQEHAASVAKLRALRLLWKRLLEQYAVPDMPPAIHAETSYRMLTVRDPESNVLRNTVACFSAMRGGADSISVIPHTQPHGLPDARARRIARNTPLVLGHEAGAYLPADTTISDSEIDALAASMAEAAWAEFQAIESEGGILRSVLDGRIQQRIAEARETKAARLRDGEQAIVGTTLHPTPDIPEIDIAPPPAEPSPPDGTIFCNPLPVLRIDELVGEAA
ncbi:MAG: methylmalonyl-CoA mutase [Rhizobiaceae bacterium]|nr:methylmalonyl-CoA mutase [Rhizobiaceae bacterium]